MPRFLLYLPIIDTVFTMHIQNVPRQNVPRQKVPGTKRPRDKTSQGTKRPKGTNEFHYLTWVAHYLIQYGQDKGMT